ncbi:hypothetical protein KUTeg_005447 [Tegillarca granosa]|uniref:Hydroxylysine kinase n=1 Tax=Tegillarca granosa TaxID=220873 RepID=A0ABQ9FJQ4_TEGGR|nr:hypothetical protein KUTeg_005447 [Tegillarca granosa]
MSTEEFEYDKGKKYIVRLFEFLPGRILEGAPYTADLLFEIGKVSGEIDKACQDQKQLAVDVIDAFKREVVDHYEELRSGTIHADFGEQNILIRKSEIEGREYEVAGILDFGDSAFSYYIFEIAINMCYMMLDSNVLDTFETGGHMLAGYLSVFNLPQKDMQILKECICARMIQSLIVGIYSAKMDPKNLEYITKTSARGWGFLKKLWKTPKKEMYKKFSNCVSKYGIVANFSENT